MHRPDTPHDQNFRPVVLLLLIIMIMIIIIISVF